MGLHDFVPRLLLPVPSDDNEWQTSLNTNRQSLSSPTWQQVRLPSWSVVKVGLRLKTRGGELYSPSSFPVPPFSSPAFLPSPSSYPIPLLSPSLRSSPGRPFRSIGPLNTASECVARLYAPLAGLWQSLSGNQIWRIFGLKTCHLMAPIIPKFISKLGHFSRHSVEECI